MEDTKITSNPSTERLVTAVAYGKLEDEPDGERGRADAHDLATFYNIVAQRLDIHPLWRLMREPLPEGVRYIPTQQRLRWVAPYLTGIGDKSYSEEVVVSLYVYNTFDNLRKVELTFGQPAVDAGRGLPAAEAWALFAGLPENVASEVYIFFNQNWIELSNLWTVLADEDYAKRQIAKRPTK